MIGASYGGFMTLEYAVAYPEHLYGAIIGDAAAQWSHWAAMTAIKIAVTDPRVKPDPDLLIRAMTGTVRSDEEFFEAAIQLMPLYSVPDDLKCKVETDTAAVLATATFPVSLGRRKGELWGTNTLALGSRHCKCGHG